MSAGPGRVGGSAMPLHSCVGPTLSCNFFHPSGPELPGASLSRQLPLCPQDPGLASLPAG